MMAQPKPALATVEDPAPAEDSRKRRQIVDGATRAFLSLGFNGASMGEIARLAGVSKGTLYVYFENKEQLFEACIEAKRKAKFDQLLDFDMDKPVQDELTRFGHGIMAFLTNPEVIMAMRTVIGIAEQMPDLGERFYANGPARTTRILADYLTKKAEQGEIEVADPELAATQFVDMCQSMLLRPLLFGCALSEEDVKARIRKSAAQAIFTFMRTYGTGR